MSDTNDGGPAFPLCQEFWEKDHKVATEQHSGMSLRAWLVSQEKSVPPLSWWQALYGERTTLDLIDGVTYREGLVKWRVQMADAMLYALTKDGAPSTTT